MDEIGHYNKERWEALVQANVLYSRPWLDLEPATARVRLDLDGIVDEVEGQQVLLLAGGGGQQSAAFALLGSQVTVLDITEGQLARDREAAAHYGVAVRTIQGDMRDLSAFAPASFDLVYHPHSLNFVPDALTVFSQVARVLRPGGHYRFGWHNPYNMGVEESSWDGRGYPLRLPYVDGEVVFGDLDWTWEQPGGGTARVRGPREFRHTFSTVVNGLADLGFVIRALREEGGADLSAEPGTWGHFCAVAPPYLATWAVFQPATARKPVVRFYHVDRAYGCLSNFAPFPIMLKDTTWPTTEHYFQAQKFAGTPREEEVRLAPSPLAAAELGHDPHHPLPDDWDQRRIGVMYEALEAKFTQHAGLRRILLNTGQAQLVEHTENDGFWGDGGDGSGQNMLGQLLMRLRTQLRAQP